MWGAPEKTMTPEHASDDRMMRLAIRESLRSLGRVHPNPPVGCVLVRDGEVVGRGHTQSPPGPHAEVMALGDAGEAARGATLYTTLEPCHHHGRTPPCTGAIRRAGVSRVVFSVKDPHLFAGGGGEALRAAGLTVEEGAGAPVVEAILRPFLHWARTGSPWVTLKAAMTLDGKTASATGASRWITSPVARASVHRLRQRLGAVMVGIGTARADDPLLNVRREHSTLALPAPPRRIVVDSGLRLPLDSRLVLSADELPLLVACREDADPRAEERLRAAGADVLRVPARERRVDSAILMRELGARGITGILLEGGGELAFSALAAGCVQEVIFFVAPLLMGGRDAHTPLSGTGFATPDEAAAVHGLTARRCGCDLVLSGRPRPW